MEQIFKIEGEYIELIQLLKALGLAQTGGHAKMIVSEEMVLRNGEVETRKRAKLIPGDVIQILDNLITLA
ncbi:MAG: RNA-binding S4 domain-containing protein [Flavobacteriia bacterium]|nr:RNA-binding S4 domain-containing protein [Flavobacteriia bacterium]